MMEELNDENFLQYSAKYYDNPQCLDIQEFLDDINRIKYIKKLLTRYDQNKELKERLILNHIIILSNVFGPIHTPRILYLKAKEYFPYIIPFLLILNIMPRTMYNIAGEKVINLGDFEVDKTISERLKKI